MAKSSLFWLALVLAIAGVYLPGLGNGLLFDDFRLRDGIIFNGYGNLLEFKQRMLSYGSFVWVQSLVGEGWWKQRIVNIALHLAVVGAIYALFSALMRQTRFPQDIEEQEHFAASRKAALHFGLVLFALNPVAVYAVGYLVQRSIVMATLFSVLACWAFVRGLESRRIAWFAGALVSYALAVMSKEHAIMTAALAVPLYIHVRRPGWKATAMVLGGALLALAVALGILLSLYGDIVGRVFDDQSRAFTRQLEALRPGITSRMYPLSILNEAALFFAYGLRWVLPYGGWMSIDLRPAFPLGFTSPWHLLGALGYLTLLGVSVWALLRRTGALSLAALCLLFPLLWYVTEFSTVWVQDPFVLYRSYLWAVALPGLAAIVLTGFAPRTLYVLGAILALVLGTLSMERLYSLADEPTAWADAAAKIDRDAPPNAVGRSRPLLNLGAQHLKDKQIDQAERYLVEAQSFGDLGELGRSVNLNAGVVLQQRNKHAQALQAFAAVEAQGSPNLALYYHRGESQYALGQFAPALQSFSNALQEAMKNENEKYWIPNLLLRRAETAAAAQRYDIAISDFQQLFQADPSNMRLAQGLGLALLRKGQGQQALQLFDSIVARDPNPSAYYGRAMIHHNTGNTAQALKDLDQAIQLAPGNPQYRKAREQLIAATKKR